MGYPRTSYASSKWGVRDRTADHQHRLSQFIGGTYAETNLSSVLIKARCDDVRLEMWSAPGHTKPTFDEAKSKLDGDTNHWIKITMTIPESWAQQPVELHFDPSCEAMIFDHSGDSLQGITGGFDYNRRVEWIVPAAEVAQGKCVRYIEVTANGMFGLQPSDQADPNVYYTLKTADIVLPNIEAQALAHDFEILQQLATTLPEKSPVGNKARAVANDIMNMWRGRPEDVARGREMAQQVFGKDWEGQVSEKQQDGDAWAIGYCHIDTAWLWPWSSTKQKIARSWSSQLDLMDRYPEFRFMATAAQHFSWLEELYPKLFKRVQEKVKSGQFGKINGGCWVETDGNLPSGESLCRQFLYGQRYFRSRFGKTTDTLILPDSFGFGPTIPQIARLGGCQYYFSNRVGLMAVDPFPYTSFNWVGLDGSQLLSHVTPITRYDSLATIEEITRAHSGHKNQESSPDSVIAFGHGDGGGGPRPLLLERLRRARAAGQLSNGQSAEMPLVRQCATLSDFFKHVQKTTRDGTELPDWNGELYLENMRGTFTTQSNTKRNFRKSENLLREAELFSTLASIHTGYSYPKERLDKTYQALCLCMFHDTLPGSSIRLAVEDYDREFAKIQMAATEMKDSAIRALQSRTTGSTKAVINTLPGLSRSEVVEISGGDYKVITAGVGDLHGREVAVQADQAVSVDCIEGEAVLQNASLRVKIAHGRITSIWDIAQKREILSPGCTAGFRLHEDHPVEGDAWQIDQFDLDDYDDLAFSSCTVTCSGPARATVECQLKIGKSDAVVRISLDACPASTAVSARSLLRFDCQVDWHERHQLLKFTLPLSFHADYATYDAAFGVHRRPTTRNNSWETAKFEGTGHKFADYSEFGYGVAILNDCKYGYAAQGNLLSLSLLRGTNSPDGEADQGGHRFSFAVYPHEGTYAESDVQVVAHAFNNPLQVVKSPLVSDFSTLPFRLEGARNVLMESIKRGEDDFDAHSFVEHKGSKTVILRLHEHMGGRAITKLVLSKIQVSKAELVNVLEDSLEDLDVKTDEESEEIDLEFRSFEIKTVKLTLV
ncbi:alpha-mannosidase [Kockovaella imperatae]|uniref:alpha-mannosidase n=1 Tax=Kockovaella imperatae TaxID=4999 RepID=A0A1Y1UQJ4_9TREE|nr:alpha-mannosidase [Kockovaella imperatae]ORX40242.1 alpha-mannosidase [Kockovaella imperatae]